MVVRFTDWTNLEFHEGQGRREWGKQARPTLSATAWRAVAAGTPVAPPAIRHSTDGRPRCDLFFGRWIEPDRLQHARKGANAWRPLLWHPYSRFL